MGGRRDSVIPINQKSRRDSCENLPTPVPRCLSLVASVGDARERRSYCSASGGEKHRCHEPPRDETRRDNGSAMVSKLRLFSALFRSRASLYRLHLLNDVVINWSFNIYGLKTERACCYIRIASNNPTFDVYALQHNFVHGSATCNLVVIHIK